MKTRVALLFVILSLLATTMHAADFKKGVGTSWFKNVHNWTGTWGTASKPGKRYYEDTVADIRRFKKAGFDHVRLHFHLDGLVFWKECKGWDNFNTYDETVQCYQKNWANQKKAKWKTKQRFFIDNKTFLNLFNLKLNRLSMD